MDPTKDENAYKEEPGALYNSVLDKKEASEMGFRENRIMSSTFHIKKLLDAKPALGFIVTQADIDGVFRKKPLATNVESIYLPSYALVLFSLFTDDNTTLEIDQAGDGNFKFKNGDLFVSYGGKTRIRRAGGTDYFDAVSIKTS